MRWISSDDIRVWASRYDVIGQMPGLLQRLVRASSAKSTFFEFPDGKQIFSPGRDGYVNSELANNEVPAGISIWEIGTTARYKSKADEDYDKRTNSPNGYGPSTSTFIFVTPHDWPNKDEWITKKMAEGHWKEIRIYDCVNLATWLENTEVVARDYAKVISSYPSDNLQTTEDFWLEWSTRENGITLPPVIVTKGREAQVEQIRNFLAGDPSIRAVVAPSKEEAIAFIIASALQFDYNDQANFFAKSLIVDSENSFRRISNKKQGLVIISRIEGNIVHRGVVDGNHVLLPLGADDTYPGEVIRLQRIEKQGMIDALILSGASESEAQRFVRECGLNITVLKKLLGFALPRADWAKAEYARQVIPAALIERWDESRPADKEIIQAISNKGYDQYIQELTQWKNSAIPFLYQIGTSWRLTAPLDAWTELSNYFTAGDLKNLETAFNKVLTFVRPALDLPPEKRQYAEIYDDKTTNSNWIREGIIQSLILVAIYGENLKLPVQGTAQSWVDTVVRNLLANAQGKLWSTLNYVLPQLAEASPDSFLSSIEKSLRDTDPELMEMFVEEPGFLSKHSHHTGLLWGLEGLAWFPEYLSRITQILGRLSSLDPGGSLSNRPINTLRSIFLPWMPQTYADLKIQFDALNLLRRSEPEVAWRLMISLLPKHHDVAHPTHKTRWRLFSSVDKITTYEDVWAFHTHITNILITNTQYNEDKIAVLLDNVDDMRPDDRKTVVDFILSNSDKIIQSKFTIWNTARKLLHQHRSHQDTNWALPKSALWEIAAIYEKFKPESVIDRNIWMFEENWPEFPEGWNHEKQNHDDQQQFINEKRKDALTTIKKEYGIEKVIELANTVKEKFSYGRTLAFLLTEENEIELFLTKDRLEDLSDYVLKGFLMEKDTNEGSAFLLDTLDRLISKEYSAKAIANFLTSLKQNQELWNKIELMGEDVSKNYWTNINPYLFHLSLSEKEYAIERLLRENRGLTAILESYRDAGKLNSQLVVRMLQEAVHANEQVRFPSHEIEMIFDELDKTGSVDKAELARLEWMYLTVLSSNYTRRKPRILYEELATDPNFFIEILKLLYKPKKITEAEENLTEGEKKSKASMAEQAYRLLSNWNKVPGTDENNLIDDDKLRNWVKDVRTLAEKEYRLEVADIHIGKILAKFPAKKGEHWPPEIIAEVIDTTNSERLTSGFGTEIFNLNGFSSKSPYEGGQRERNLAKYFTDMADRIYSRWPITASVFRNLAKGYLDEAKREDDRAEKDLLEY